PQRVLQERILKVVELGRTVMHYGWIPMIIYMGYTRSSPQPMFIKSVSPFSSCVALTIPVDS
ncbi:Tom7-domain-containing protein, partial [Boletus edulis BED1]